MIGLKIKTKVKGDGIKAAFKKYEKQFDKTTHEVLEDIAEDILLHSVSITPIDTGELRKSRRIDTDTNVSYPEVKLGYYISYAKYVHEVDYNYRVGGYKYLEKAVNQKKDDSIALLKQSYTKFSNDAKKG